MSSSPLGLNAAVDGIAGVGEFLAPCTGDPGTTGANIDTAVTPLAADWSLASGGSADSAQVAWEIPSGGGTRDYSHFAVVTTADDTTYEYVTGGQFTGATVEQFSDNGGTLRFTGTLEAEDPPA